MAIARTSCLAVFALFVAWAPSASALSLSVPAASVGTLAANGTATSTTSSLVISGLPLESWVLRADVTTSGATDGHMTRVTSSPLCDQGVAALDEPLHLSFTGTLPSTTIVIPEYDLASQNNPVVAQGSAPDVVKVIYSQPVGIEAIGAGCTYGVNVRYTASAS